MIKILALTLFSFFISSKTSASSAICLYYNSIVDTDELANKEPKMYSVAWAKEQINKYPDLESRTEVQLHGNSLTFRGATEIINYLLEKMPQLKKLDLSHNPLTKGSTCEEYFPIFCDSLKKLLQRPQFQEIKLSGTDVHLEPWLSAIQEIDKQIGSHKVNYFPFTETYRIP